MSDTERFKGRNVTVRRDEVRPNTYVVKFPRGFAQLRGSGNPDVPVPPTPEAIVEIVDGEATVRWRVRASEDENILKDFTETAKEVALKEHGKSEKDNS